VIKLTNKVRNEDQADGQSKKQKREDDEEDNEAREEEEKEEMKLYERWAEEYYEIVEQLPLELHRTFTLMRELEFKMQDRITVTASHVESYRNARIAQRNVPLQQPGEQPVVMQDIVHPYYGSSSDQDAEGEDDEEVFHEVVEGTPPKLIAANATAPPVSAARLERQLLLQKVAISSSEAIRAAEEKVGLAVTAYDWVDRHIRRLDGDLQRSESSLLLGLRAGTEASRGVRDALGISEGDNLYNRKEGQPRWEDDSLMSSQSTPIPPNTGRKKGAAAVNNKTNVGDSSNAGLSASLMTDMAIDPNEPKYCYCDQVSSGDMVACDNEDCPREWFHYQCVGLTAPPKGRWYCLFCAPPGYKGSGTFPPNAPCLPPGYGGKGGDGGAAIQQTKKSNHKKKKR